MYERSLQLLERPPDFGTSAISFGHVTKDPNELYVCGCCRVLLDRLVAPSLLQRTIIVCPNCGSVNLP